MPLDDTSYDRTQLFASNLDRLMTLRGIKNPWLAMRIGVSRQAVHQWRRGETYPSGTYFEDGPTYLEYLCEVLGCTEADLTKPPFAANIANLMNARKLNRKALAARMDVPEDSVDQWLSGEKSPTETDQRLLAEALDCTISDIMGTPDVLTLSMWAKREGIPITRAQSLFDLKILKGQIKTPFGLLIPTGIRSPVGSKLLVMAAKHRPKWGLIGQYKFIHNFNKIVARQGLKASVLAEMLGVSPITILHWQNGQRSPDEARIPDIAKALGCTVATLMAKSSEATKAMEAALVAKDQDDDLGTC